MQNFSLAKQVINELHDFKTTRIKLAAADDMDDMSVRMLKPKSSGYYFNQHETLTIIDLYYNSKFRNGARDKLGQRKIFMNVGKFRCDVSSKQIDLDTKDFRFIPDDYADPFTAFFMQKDFKEWAKDMDPNDVDCDEGSFGDLVNKGVDNFPRYGTVVLKKVGGKLVDVPLQNLRNEQTAKSLQSASYVIEEHPDMYFYEIQDMQKSGKWNLGTLNMRFNQKLTVYERYGRVPVKWLKAVMKSNGLDETVVIGTDEESVDAVAFVALDAPLLGKNTGEIVFYAAPVKNGRPYREKHWSRQHGRWLGMGVMEDLIENQEAKNIIVNLQRRSLHWASKRIWQSTTTDMVGKNLVRDVQDGEILEVGASGAITSIDMTNKALGEFAQFGAGWDQNADQKAFTYEASLLNNGSKATAFRLGALLTSAAQAFFARKKQMLGIFYRNAIIDFMVPQFIKDMSSEDRVKSIFPGEYGYEKVKKAAEQVMQLKTAHHTILGGTPFNAASLAPVTAEMNMSKSILINIEKDAYKNAKYRFDLVVADTDDSVDTAGLIKTLTIIYQAMVQAQDPRAEKVLERIAALSGVDVEAFGIAPEQPVKSPISVTPGAGQGQEEVPANGGAQAQQ